MAEERIVPRTMSTQHPDNVTTPFFANGEVLGGEDEVKETFYVYSHLGCQEQLWDCEGKEADQFVIRKLFVSYEDFFKKNVMGEDIFLTLRIPNPDIERSESKIVLETLESIPRSSDLASIFYGERIAPVFEVALPMTTRAEQLVRVSRYYKKFVAGKSAKEITSGFQVKKWMGDFFPKEIRVIPLFEDLESILKAPEMIEKFVSSEKIKDHVRVWFARSDPALNYGSAATVLLLKIALRRLHEAEKRLEIGLYPILGCGTAPFRGNLYPGSIEDFLKGYPSVQTFTIQSAFKYDYPVKDVQDAVRKLNGSIRKEPPEVEREKEVLALVKKMHACYDEEVRRFFPKVVPATRIIPQRRKRKLHIGLFGYSRGDKSLKLPRAIPFCAAFYSLGFPPELMGLSCLNGKDLELIEQAYPSIFRDLSYAVRFLNDDNLKRIDAAFYARIKPVIEHAGERREMAHYEITSKVYETIAKNEGGESLKDLAVRAANIRHFLG